MLESKLHKRILSRTYNIRKDAEISMRPPKAYSNMNPRTYSNLPTHWFDQHVKLSLSDWTSHRTSVLETTMNPLNISAVLTYEMQHAFVELLNSCEGYVWHAHVHPTSWSGQCQKCKHGLIPTHCPHEHMNTNEKRTCWTMLTLFPRPRTEQDMHLNIVWNSWIFPWSKLLRRFGWNTTRAERRLSIPRTYRSNIRRMLY